VARQLIELGERVERMEDAPGSRCAAARGQVM
jgi:hypothetical protein